jgi:hypothetical protein
LDQAKLLADVFLKCLAQQDKAVNASGDTASKDGAHAVPNLADDDDDNYDGDDDGNGDGDDGEYQGDWGGGFGHGTSATPAVKTPETSEAVRALANKLIQVWKDMRAQTAVEGGGQLLRGVSVDTANLPLDLRYRSLLQPLRFGFVVVLHVVVTGLSINVVLVAAISTCKPVITMKVGSLSAL